MQEDGFLIIDKPSGITSFDVIRKFRKITGIKKIGHAGTLDPLATGVLILAFGKATKKLTDLIGLDKEYEAEIKFGAISDTYDREGKITKIDEAKNVSLAEIKVALEDFIGEISQMPPKYSALKVNGQKACDVMRKGGDIQLKPRQIKIYKLDLLDYQWPVLKIRVKCSSGTYIRSLAHDIGQKLECGAYLNQLRRTQVGEFLIGNAKKLDDPELLG